ncbi:MAG: hypothetical protein KF788_20240 [Piscinibacter sp.]|nr:hypothetical protein [Piscinibacter sp.]
MNARPATTPLPEWNANLHDAARRRALDLRSEAIDAFWAAAGRALRRGTRTLHERLLRGMLVARQPRRT